jgi:hypothetical protein
MNRGVLRPAERGASFGLEKTPWSVSGNITSLRGKL